MLVKMPDPVAGEMYLPGATIKSRRPPAASAMSRRRASIPIKCSPILGYDAARLAELREAKVIG